MIQWNPVPLSPDKITLALAIIAIIGGSLMEWQKKIAAAAAAKVLKEQVAASAQILADQMAAKAAEDDKHRQWEIEDRATWQASVTSKMDSQSQELAANTQISVEAFHTANTVNDKIASLAMSAKSDAAVSMADLTSAIGNMSTEVSKIRTAQTDLAARLDLSEQKVDTRHLEHAVQELTKETSSIRTALDDTRAIVLTIVGQKEKS